MKNRDQMPDKGAQTPVHAASEKRSGEGSASALARLRMQEKAKAAARAGKRTPKIFC